MVASSRPSGCHTFKHLVLLRRRRARKRDLRGPFDNALPRTSLIGDAHSLAVGTDDLERLVGQGLSLLVLEHHRCDLGRSTPAAPTTGLERDRTAGDRDAAAHVERAAR